MRSFIFAIFCLLLSAPFAHAQSNRTPTPDEQKQIDEYNDALAGKEPVERAEPTQTEIKTETPPEQSQKKDLQSTPRILGIINYAPFDLFIPSKLGATAGYRFTPKTTLELEYLRGSLSVPFLFESLGGMTDQRLSLYFRSHFGKSSFNYFYGIAYHMFRLKIGNEIVNRAVPHSSEFDEIQLNSVGFLVGLGNRWIIEDNFIVGVDWALWSQPLLETEKKTEFLRYVSDADRGRFEKAIDFVSEFPRLSFVKLTLGMAF